MGGHTKYECAASTIIREITLTSENLKNWAILDFGVSNHFLLPATTVLSKMVADPPLEVTLPNGDVERSRHIAELDLPQLPRAGRVVRIVPGLASHSLVSVVKLCNAGCEVGIRDISCKTWCRGGIIVQCSKDASTGLWMMLLTNNMEVNHSSRNKNYC